MEQCICTDRLGWLVRRSHHHHGRLVGLGRHGRHGWHGRDGHRHNRRGHRPNSLLRHQHLAHLRFSTLRRGVRKTKFANRFVIKRACFADNVNLQPIHLASVLARAHRNGLVQELRKTSVQNRTRMAQTCMPRGSNIIALFLLIRACNSLRKRA